MRSVSLFAYRSFPALLAFLTCALASPMPVAGESTPLRLDPRLVTEETEMELLWTEQAAQEALKLGFTSLSSNLYRHMLQILPPGDARRTEASLNLASSLIGEGSFPEAKAVLDAFEGEQEDAYHLRRAVLHWNLGETKRVGGFLRRIDAERLSRADRGWFFFLRGLLADADGATSRAEGFYDQALAHSVSESQRAQFTLTQFQAKLLTGDPSDSMARQLEEQMRNFQGRSAGYRFAQQYAVVLDLLGRKQEALDAIVSQLQVLPREEAGVRDQFLLLEGLISGPRSDRGRQSFRQLLESGSRVDLQRLALQKLSGGMMIPRERDGLRALLGRLISDSEPHVLLPEMRLLRARMALHDGRHEDARADADAILNDFPGTGHEAGALRILATSAWQQRQYRTAADYISQVRANISEGPERTDLGVLMADCYFRAADYRNAADAYASALREGGGSLPSGLLVFQRVLSEIRAGRISQAASQLDQFSNTLSSGNDFRWRGEWNLVKAMQQDGAVDRALNRVERLLQENTDRLPQDLHLRMLWLKSQLSLEAGQADESIAALDRLEVSMEAAPRLDGALGRLVRSNALLLRGQAQFALDRADDARATLERLREQHAGSEAAVYSILVEARYLSSVNRTVDAQRMLVFLADRYPMSNYAPVALYEAAVNASRRGVEAAYQEQAISLFERIVKEYSDNPLTFYARLKQGDILRQINRFGAAQQVYEMLLNAHPNHPDRFLVQISLADCHLALAGTGDTGRYDMALSILERLFDLPNVPPELRAEAGFKFAFATSRSGQPDRAAEIYWATVSNLLLNEGQAVRLGSGGRYWVARAVFELGRFFEEQNRFTEAVDAYNLVSRFALPGQSLARARLEQIAVAIP